MRRFWGALGTMSGLILAVGAAGNSPAASFRRLLHVAQQ